jgi:glycosyltransferase involved in cell wall biosynthesis
MPGNRIKILINSNSLAKGGKERQIIELINGLVKDQTFIIGICLREDRIEYPIACIGQITLYKPAHRLSFRELLLFHYKVIREFKPDIIHNWEGGVGLSMSVVHSLFFRKIKIIDGTIRFSKKLPLNSLDHWVTRFNHIVADRVIANSFAGLTSLHRKADRKFQVIHNGFDFGRFLDYNNSPHKVGTTINIGMVASFSQAKDYKNFILAATRLLGYRKDLHFYCIGDGPEKKSIESALAAELKEHFTFTGNVTNPEKYVSTFTLGILLNKTGHSEGMSNSIMEYMMLGLPVICTRTGGNLELVEDGVNGYFVEFENLNDIYEKMNSLLQDHELCIAMGRRSKEIAIERFSLDTMVKKYSEVYNSLLRR